MTVINLSNYRSKKQKVTPDQMDAKIAAHALSTALQTTLIAQYMFNADMVDEAERLCHAAELIRKSVDSLIPGGDAPCPAA